MSDEEQGGRLTLSAWHFSACLLLLAVVPAVLAAPIDRGDFPADAVEFGFGAPGEGTLSDGSVFVSGVTLDRGNPQQGVDWWDFEPANAIGNEQGDEITFLFFTPVLAFGFDFIANDTCSTRFYDTYQGLCGAEIVDIITVTAFDSFGSVLDDLTFDMRTMPNLALPYDFPYAFAGLEVDDPDTQQIRTVTLEVELPDALAVARVDNLIYVPAPAVAGSSDLPSRTAVPEPSTLALFASAVAGISCLRRRRSWQ